MIKQHFKTLVFASSLAIAGGAVLGADLVLSSSDSPSAQTLGVHVPFYDIRDYADGKREALRDLDAGKLVLKTYGMPSGSRRTYADIIRSEYGIELWAVAGCVVSQELVENARGYNEVMMLAIDDRFGAEVLDSASRRAEVEYREHLEAQGD